KQTPGVTIRSAQSAAPVGPALKAEYPVVKDYVRLILSEGLAKSGDKIFEERKIFYADASVFNIFSFSLTNGDPTNALKDPGSIVLTESTASKYFGKEDAVGKQISIDGSNFKVTGVLADVPPHSHIEFDFLVSMATAEQKGSGFDWLFTNWYSNNFHTYLRIEENADIRKLSADMKAFDLRHGETGSTTLHQYAFEKLTEIYLHSDRQDQIGKTGNASNLYIFSAIAIFLIVIACINFVNLSTARFTVRAKEVGIKKVAGASRKEIMIQFFSEAFVLTGIAIGAALIIAYSLLPVFNNFTGKAIVINLFQPVQVLSILGLLVTISLLAGAYPAIILSGFTPIVSLKGKAMSSGWSISFRKALVVFQFATSVILVICTIVVYRQMDFLQRKDRGFNSTQTMVINFEGDRAVRSRFESVKAKLNNIRGVEAVTASSNVPGDGKQGGWSMDFAMLNGDTLQTEMPVYLVDFDFTKQYGLSVVHGRELSAAYAADTIQSMLINETAVKKLGLTDPSQAIGVKVGMYPNDAKIVGVLKDFHFEGLQKAVTPLAMRILPDNFRLLSLKLSGNDLRSTIKNIESQWSKIVPERPLEYVFLDDSFNRQYLAEIRFGQVFAVFATIAILIACLGLFGLALFSVQQRTKEIGIRKVLGAGVTSIAKTISSQFVWLVMIAVVVASPVAYILMKNWLQQFAFRIDLSLWIFVLAGVSALVISLITISYHTIRAALVNPVESIKADQ
ncbi:MAG: ABC transporter permease, partial [Chitinophagaceae bacterium]